MAKGKEKVVFFCSDCGNETAKWDGQCRACGAWNTLVEETVVAKPKTKGKTAMTRGSEVITRAKTLDEVENVAEIRFDTGMGELNRVLGGGAVRGSLVLIGGAPGVGKSTLMLQICGQLSEFGRVLYVSGEESQRQIKMRAERLGVEAKDLFLLPETNLEQICDAVGEIKPDTLIVDSIQTLYTDESPSVPGSVTQVKQCTMRLMNLAKGQGLTVFVIGHVNKEGDIAGPRVLEHMVDCVLYVEGGSNLSYKILRAAKNRFGSTNEIGVFEMTGTGLREVPNPSELLLSGRPENAPGTCVTSVMEGTRPVLAEIQALLVPNPAKHPRRNANGIDFGRAALLLAVAEKRGGLAIGGCDAYINVIGGLEIDEPAADLAAILAIASSYRSKPIDSSVVAIGEVGLTGEIRTVTGINQRLAEIARLGFARCVLPVQDQEKLVKPEGLRLTMVKTIRDAFMAVGI
ncbi:MAG: DNA repair protein RadA [Oscillospiraceae bacterium]|nr:DNA repair protein RadA [Oscillospiraceae bacterium]